MMNANASPRLTMRRKRPPTSGEAALRFIAALAGALNPLTLVILALIVTVARLGFRQRRIGLPLAAIGIGTLALSVWWKTYLPYIRPWLDIYKAFTAHSFDTYVSNSGMIGTVFFDVLRQNWRAWLWVQIPFAATLALSVAGVYLAWRDYYSDDWRSGSADTPKLAKQSTIERAKRRQDKAIAKTPPAKSLAALTVPLGIDAYTAKPISVPVGAWRTHALVCGPTGVGKTQALMRIMHSFTLHPQANALRVPLLIIDMKADPELAAYARALAQCTGRTFHHVTVKSGSYNPVTALDGDELADSIYETVFANDPTLNTHYATLSRRLLQIAAATLLDLADNDVHKVGTQRAWQRSLSDLTDLLSLNALRSVQTDLTPHAAARLHVYLGDIDAADNAKDVGDVRDRMAVIMHTSAGEVLTADGFTLESAIRNGDIVVFSLDAAGSPETARTIGTLAVQDLIATFGRLQHNGWGKQHICPVLLDEFSALGTPKVADLYARARSAGGAIILATQDIDADLEAVSPEFSASVRTNANVWIVLRQTRADVAEALSRDLGSQTTWKETLQITDDFDLLGGLHAASGVGSLREVEEFILHPSLFKNLPQGGAYLFVKIPTGSLNTANAETLISRLHINAPQPLTLQQEPFAQAQTMNRQESSTSEPWPEWVVPPEDDTPPF